MVRKSLVREEVLGIDVLEHVATYSFNGALTVNTGAGRYRFPFPVTIMGVSAAVNSAPSGAGSFVTLDVNKNGNTMFTTQANRPSIAAAANATTSEAVPDVTNVSTGDYLTIDIDSIGSVSPGSDLTVFVRYRRT